MQLTVENNDFSAGHVEFGTAAYIHASVRHIAAQNFEGAVQDVILARLVFCDQRVRIRL